MWAARASAYRQALRKFEADVAYGAEERHRFDLIYPDSDPKGLVVFIHGGFWLSFSKSDWTDHAEGARANGWAVALPSYTLAPGTRISPMGQKVSAAIQHAATLIKGPIRLMGHSAGGHLATRMVCDDHQLPISLLDRVEKVLSISGVRDLRPLQKTAMNQSLQLTDAEAISESPALHLPAPDIRLTCWVGAGERPEFLRQSRLMAAIWGGEAQAELVEEPGHHHFSVIEALKRPDSPIISSLLE